MPEKQNVEVYKNIIVGLPKELFLRLKKLTDKTQISTARIVRLSLEHCKLEDLVQDELEKILNKVRS